MASVPPSGRLPPCTQCVPKPAYRSQPLCLQPGMDADTPQNRLLRAVFHGQKDDVVELVHKEGVEILNCTSQSQDSPLHMAISNLLDRHEAGPDVAPREAAAMEMVRTLVDLGADVERIESQGLRDSPLRRAVRAGATALIRLLLEAGADVDPEDDDVEAHALIIAVQYNRLQAVMILCDWGMLPRLGALMAAAHAKHWKVLYWFLDGGGGPYGDDRPPYLNNTRSWYPLYPAEGPDAFDVEGSLIDPQAWTGNPLYAALEQQLSETRWGAGIPVRERACTLLEMAVGGSETGRDAQLTTKLALLAGAANTQRARRKVGDDDYMGVMYSDKTLRIILDACVAPAEARRAWWLRSRTLRWRLLGGWFPSLLELVSLGRAAPLAAIPQPQPAAAAGLAGPASRTRSRSSANTGVDDDGLGVLMARVAALPREIQGILIKHVSPTPTDADYSRIIDTFFTQVCCQGVWDEQALQDTAGSE